MHRLRLRNARLQGRKNVPPGQIKRAANDGRPRCYRMKLSNNHEIAVSSFPILWTPSRMRLRISGRGFLQPDA